MIDRTLQTVSTTNICRESGREGGSLQGGMRILAPGVCVGENWKVLATLVARVVEEEGGREWEGCTTICSKTPDAERKSQRRRHEFILKRTPEMAHGVAGAASCPRGNMKWSPQPHLLLLVLLLLGVLGILCAMDGIPAPCYLGNSLALLRHNEVLASSSNAYA